MKNAASPPGAGSAASGAATEELAELDRAPIARIVVMAGTQTVSRGTGTLVAPKLVLSALHVVANRRTDPPQPYPGEIRLEFPAFTTTGTILPGAWDRTADWVLIECAEAPSVTPMRLAALNENKREWESFGFPDANARDGLLVTGNVMMCEGQLEGTRVHQLYCPQAAAGAGARVKGLSGAPVVIAGHLVGVVRFALMEQDRTEMGTLYACPVSAVAERWPSLTVTPLPKDKRLSEQLLAANAARAGWELSAIAGSLAVVALTIFALSQLHVPSTDVEGRVHTDDVQFTLSSSAPMQLDSRNGLLGATSMDVTGLEAVTVPGASGARSSLAMPSAHFESGGGGDTSSSLNMDLSGPLSAGAHVWLHATPTSGRFRIRFDSVPSPLKIQFLGTMRLGPDESALKPYRTALGDSALLVALDGKTITTELAIEPKTKQAHLDAPLSVRSLGFFASDRSTPGRTRVPAIAGGDLQIDGRLLGHALKLHDRDSLAFGPDTLQINDIIFPSDSVGKLQVRFGGKVRQLSIGADGVTRNLMPTWLSRLRYRYGLESAVVGAAFAAFLAFLIVRWRKRKVA